ncbi:MAG: ABC transporter ATP-binding protein [Chloroflexota bacterium]|jgi:ABC-2 type transport system ATP-binding protein/lipopolysaccharide transport system ATP-binding protein
MSLPTAPETLKSLAALDGLPVVDLQDVTVRYRVPRERFRTFKEFAIRRVQGRAQFEDLLALDGVSLQVRRGEVFGLIGANGAGKTTLLRLVARVMRPTRGRVIVRGRVAPLLAMGAGFHAELTGRENVFLNGTLLGYTRWQIEERMEWIVDFAELREFIDAPLRTYSSGMMARLGFAVATAAMPEVLIVDEVLSVGDIAFQEKSAARIREFREAGATILLVSHSMAMVKKMCSRAAWLSRGQVMELGEAASVVSAFESFMKKTDT